MIKIRDIEETISQLPPRKLAEFRRWFAKFDPAYRLGREIMTAEEQIKNKEIIPWSEIKKKHGL